MVKEPGQDGTAKAPGADAQKGSKQKRSERRLTLDMDEILMKELDSATAGENSLNYTTFRKLCDRFPDELFEHLCDRMNALEHQIQEQDLEDDEREIDKDMLRTMEIEIDELKARVKNQRDAMAELIQERDEAFARAQELARQSESASVAPASQKKSTKLPDGKRFAGGKDPDPKFASWLIDIENKLETNADHYPTALSRMQYIKSMCEGEAADHLVPRFKKDSPERYSDADDIIEHLKTIYHDANLASKAKRKLRRLFMNDAKFQDFLSQFVLTAQEAELPASQWKDELYERLSPEMQKQLVKASYDDDMTYRDFIRECHQTANRLEIIVENEKRAPKGRGNKNGNSGGSVKDTTKDTSTPNKPKDGKGKVKIPWSEKKQLMAEGKCFKCKMTGHMEGQCPFNEQSTPDLKALEPATETKEDSTSDSENEDA